MNKGFFIVQREMIENAYLRSPKVGVLMLVLHRLASFGDRTVWHRGNQVELKPGELVAGLEYLSEQTCLTVSEVRTALKIASDSQLIRMKIANDGRIVSICNWDEMQGLQHAVATCDSQAVSSEIATSETKKNKENIYIGRSDVVEPSVSERKPKFDFEQAYKAYPRKIKKSLGIKKLQSSIKTENDFADLMKAVHNYAALCVREGKEKQYIMHWSTFCNCWRDFVVLDDGTASPALPRFNV